jgi:hypothetical protein
MCRYRRPTVPCRASTTHTSAAPAMPAARPCIQDHVSSALEPIKDDDEAVKRYAAASSRLHVGPQCARKASQARHSTRQSKQECSMRCSADRARLRCRFGVKLAIQMCRKLLESGTPGFYFCNDSRHLANTWRTRLKLVWVQTHSTSRRRSSKCWMGSVGAAPAHSLACARPPVYPLALRGRARGPLPHGSSNAEHWHSSSPLPASLMRAHPHPGADVAWGEPSPGADARVP